MRRSVFDHAARLPLHRVYQLKSGGVASLLREDAGGVGELVFSLLYNPWRAIVQLVGGVLILAWVDWRFLLGAAVLAPAAFATDRLWYRLLAAPASRHPQAASADRRQGDRGVWRHAGGAGFRPAAHRELRGSCSRTT